MSTKENLLRRIMAILILFAMFVNGSSAVLTKSLLEISRNSAVMSVATNVGTSFNNLVKQSTAVISYGVNEIVRTPKILGQIATDFSKQKDVVVVETSTDLLKNVNNGVSGVMQIGKTLGLTRANFSLWALSEIASVLGIDGEYTVSVNKSGLNLANNLDGDSIIAEIIEGNPDATIENFWNTQVSESINQAPQMEPLSEGEETIEPIAEMDVQAGTYFTALLKEDGTVWTFGQNSYGQLGDGTTVNKTYPVQVKDATSTGYLTDIIQISAGNGHVIALKADGTVWAWGYNAYGQLGNNTKINLNLPVKVLNISGIVKIDAGHYHSAALDENGRIYTWGYNNAGQIGNGNQIPQLIPYMVTSISNIIDIASSERTTYAVRSNGTVWAWGQSQKGSLGNGIDSGVQFSPVQVKTNSNTGLTNIKKICSIICPNAGMNSVLALSNNGEVWTWGGGYIGDGTTTTSNPYAKMAKNIENTYFMNIYGRGFKVYKR